MILVKPKIKKQCLSFLKPCPRKRNENMKIEHYFIVVCRLFGISSFFEPEQYPLHPANGLNPVDKPQDELPIFEPPGDGDGDNRIKCNYSSMGPEWVHPDSATERDVWLRNTKTGEEWNITTNYEHKWPTGVKRKVGNN